MRPVAAAVRAVLHQLEPVRVVPPVLAGDVVAVLALLAGQGDLGPHIGGSHEGVPFSFDGPRSMVESGVPGGRPPGQYRGLTAKPRSGKQGMPASGGFQGVIPLEHTAGYGAAANAASNVARPVAEAGLEPATQRL